MTVWTTEHELVGRKVLMWIDSEEEEVATVLAVAERSSMIKVRCDSDGLVYVGNQYEEILGEE